MKKTIQYSLIFLALLFSNIAFSQTIIWSEDFDGNSGAGSNWGLLNQNIGAQGMTQNLWYISCQENGNAAGICGSGCGADNTLHVSSTSVGDLGAAYDASSLCLPGCLFCDFGFCSDVTTNIRSQSVNINTVGQTNLTLNFNYMENGQGANDNCIAEYSIDGGASWILLADPIKTVLCGSGQGLWTAQAYALPVVCEGIANLRIAFHWQNNADGLGADPSFAVDDITITTPAPLPIELFSFSGKAYNNSNLIEWVTASEMNNDYFSLERSNDALTWKEITKIKGAGNAVNTLYYQFQDRFTTKEDYYYRLKQVDFDGKYSYSDIIALFVNKTDNYSLFPNPAVNQLTVKSNCEACFIEITSLNGGVILQKKINKATTIVNVSSLKSGMYLVLIKNEKSILFREKITKQ